MKNIILDLSGACSEEGLDRLLPDAEKLDLTSIEGTNCYCDEAAAAAIRSAIAELPAAALHWDDTGDYHYLSRFWLEKASSDNGGEPSAGCSPAGGGPGMHSAPSPGSHRSCLWA